MRTLTTRNKVRELREVAELLAATLKARTSDACPFCATNCPTCTALAKYKEMTR